MTVNIAWCITGSGDRLTESIEAMASLKSQPNLQIDVILSKAGEQVVTWYKLWDKLRQSCTKLFIEDTANTPFLIGPLQLGKYDILLVYPATANTTAKIAHGIADSLITNCVAQAMKTRVPIHIFPVDQVLGEIETILPNKKKITLSMREIDVQNVEHLRTMKGITVLSDPKEVETIINELKENLAENL